MDRGFAIVIDIGKTMGKVSLWSRDGRLLDRQQRPNETPVVDVIRRLDAEGIGAWLIEAMSNYRHSPVEVIVPVAHGAAFAAIQDGALAFPPIDYEQAPPTEIATDYHRQRDPFAVTGSPALPGGLNLGRQLFWSDRLYPADMREAILIPWAQYWAWYLTGAARTEVTSLGCHSDLWSPRMAAWSPMARRLGWSSRFAPLAHAGDTAGALRPDIADRTGLPATVQVLCGLHDSNAALMAARGFPSIADAEATVLSTGTWFVAMRTPGAAQTSPALADDRDCLVNVDPDGRAMPSARFMGGREIEMLGARIDQPGIEGLDEVLLSGAMVLPGRNRGAGPFPNHGGGWLREPGAPTTRAAAVALYAALMSDVLLDLIGSRQQVLIEGRFAASDLFVRALASLRPDMQVLTSGIDTDASFGALRLAIPSLAPEGSLARALPLPGDLAAYRSEWRTHTGYAQ